MIKNLIKAVVIIVACVVLVDTVRPKKINSAVSKVIDPVVHIAPHVVPWRSLLHNNRRLATGFYIKYNNSYYIVTNRHVCDSSVETYKHRFIQFGHSVERIIKIDPVHDLCLVTSSRRSGLNIADSDVAPMEELVLVGFPRGIGKVIRYGRAIEEVTWQAPWLDNRFITALQISSTAYPGNSGSPVCNLQGEVIGVLFAGSPYYPTEPFIVPHRYLVKFLEKYAR